MTANEPTLRRILKSQYHASLAMLRDAIEKCPDDLWENTDHKNAFWQIAYHALFFAHVYFGKDEAAFRRWDQHQRNVQHEDGIEGVGPLDPNSPLPLLPKPYTKAQVLEYWRLCDGMVDESVDKLDLDNPECGFYWYKMSKLEHQFVNLRHIQHHEAQLADRLRSAANIGIRWVGSRPGV